MTPWPLTGTPIAGHRSAQPQRPQQLWSHRVFATAAYGSPLAAEIGVLRRWRDRYLATHAPGRLLIAGYYAVGPLLADVVRPRPWLRSLARGVIGPVVELARWIGL